jgi:surface carbohydrate biosynthesis protein
VGCRLVVGAGSSVVNIYLKMEIKARELEGRMLLGLAAAERGHTVLLGEMRPVVRESEATPVGVYHDTCLYPDAGQTRLRAELCRRGWLVTSQDEEHGLLEPTYNNYARKRYSKENVELAGRIFAWGPHDAASLAEVYPEAAGKVQVVGSPRMDLNRAEFSRFFQEREKPGITPGQPYVLFANNFTRVIGVNRIETFVRHMRGAGYFQGDDDPFEFLQYEEAAAQMDFLPHMIRAIRQVAKQHSNLTVVVRPHPQETEGSWRDLIGEAENVLVSSHGDIGRWTRAAVAVIQSGDTTAFEATIAGVPLIAFSPVRGDHHWAARFGNRLGINASSVDELLARVADLRDGSIDHPRLLARDRQLLSERISVSGDRLAADVIVDAWEGLDQEDRPTGGLHDLVRVTRQARFEWRAREVMRPTVQQARNLQRRFRASSGVPERPYLTAQKFPAITQREVDEIVDGYRGALGRFAGVRARLLGPRLVGLESSG